MLDCGSGPRERNGPLRACCKFDRRSRGLSRYSRGSLLAVLGTYEWAMVAAFLLILISGLVGIVPSSWEWEFFHLAFSGSP